MKSIGRKSVVVYGPQGCGKTKNAKALARYFGLNKIIDGANPKDRVPKFGALILTNADPKDCQTNFELYSYADVIEKVLASQKYMVENYL